jgi:hypothetical protein
MPKTTAEMVNISPIVAGVTFVRARCAGRRGSTGLQPKAASAKAIAGIITDLSVRKPGKSGHGSDLIRFETEGFLAAHTGRVCASGNLGRMAVLCGVTAESGVGFQKFEPLIWTRAE